MRVNNRDKVVSVRINDGAVYYDDFVAELNDHSGFSSMFEAFNDTIEITTNEPCGKKVNEKLLLNDLQRQVEHQVDRVVASDDEESSLATSTVRLAPMLRGPTARSPVSHDSASRRHSTAMST